MNQRTKLIIKESDISIDAFFALLYAIVPIVQPLKTPFSVSWSMMILIVSTPYIVYSILRKRKIDIVSSIVVIAFFLYRIVNHGTSAEELLSSLFVIGFVVALSNNLIRFEVFFKAIAFVSCCAAIGIILQVLFHSLFGIHIPMLSSDWLRTEEMASGYKVLFSTGMSGGMYRPSAFFVEPAAYFIYAFPAMFFLLLCRNQMKVSVLISIAVVLSTSGMGMAMTVGLWGVYLLRQSISKRKINRKWLLVSAFVLVVGLVVFFSSESLQNSVLRIFSGFGDNKYSAIQGRLGGGSYYISLLNPRELLFGTGGNIEELSMYMSGMYNVIYTDGMVGYGLLVLIFVLHIVESKGINKLFPVLVCVLTLVSNIYVIHYLIYYFVPVIFFSKVRLDSDVKKRI